MELEEVNQLEELLNNKSDFCLFFYAVWCPPCRMLKPIIDEYEENYPDDLIVHVNVDVIKGLHREYEVREVPTLIFFKSGVEVERFVLHVEYEEIEESFKKLKKL